MKEFHEQLKKAMEMRKVTQSELCEMTGIPKSAMSQYISGAFKPKQTRTYLIAKALRVNEAWLMGWDESVLETLDVLDSITDPDNTSAQVKEQDARTRKAISEMLDMQLYDDLEIELIKKYRTLDEYGKKAVDSILDIEYERCARTDKPQTIMIRQHLNKASAGGGYDLRNEDEWKRVRVIADANSERADFAVEVEGDSMLPDYHDGDLVLIAVDTDVPVGKVGLFRQGDKGYIKERGADRLISRNPDYPDIRGEVRCIGRVIGIAELA